ncbi:hypothetical protein [Serratia marcescens]|uniref:Uncharacterized protein n=1 Tax=Serratia marcescens TaxID=615 RepID=A0ABD6I1H8_SERMA|nr:hypothetical protein [Serratia marcescens]MVF05186.1 hypothetical protein [Serratia marcescens]
MTEWIDLNDALVRTTVRIDDGCDWTAWIIWQMCANWRMRNGIHQPPPARPKVAVVTITPIKKPKKGKRHRVEEEEYA